MELLEPERVYFEIVLVVAFRIRGTGSTAFGELQLDVEFDEELGWDSVEIVIGLRAGFGVDGRGCIDIHFSENFESSAIQAFPGELSCYPHDEFLAEVHLVLFLFSHAV